MAAGQGFKTFTTGEVLTAGDVNGYLMQGINVFTNATARDAAITAPAEGQFAFTKDNNSLWYYDGAAWVASGATGDIEGVTAGVGISGGGTSGTVTVTNSMATAIDAKGDLVPGTGADTFARLAVGANDTILTADSSTATGLKWATLPASGSVGCYAYANANSQSLGQSVMNIINLPSESWDTDGFHSTSTNTSRLTIPTGKGGIYQFTCYFSQVDTPSYNIIALFRNGVINSSYGVYESKMQRSGSNVISATVIASANAGDYFELGAQNDLAAGTYNVYAQLSAIYLGA